MCEPTTLTMLYISMASAAAGLVGQMQQADSQEASNAVQRTNALEARSQNANQVNLERLQANDAAGQKVASNNLAMREAQSTAVAAGGPSGFSVDAMLANLGSKGATYNQSVHANLDRTNMALDNQLTNVNNQAASTINQLKTPDSPDYLGAALKIGTAYQGYSSAGSTGADYSAFKDHKGQGGR